MSPSFLSLYPYRLPPWTTLATPTTQTTPTTQENSVKDPHESTEQNDIHLSVRNSPLLTKATDNAQATTTPTGAGEAPAGAGEAPSNEQTPPRDMWEKEVMELFLDFDPQLSNNSDTSIYGHAHSRTTLLLLSLAVLVWKTCLNLLAH